MVILNPLTPLIKGRAMPALSAPSIEIDEEVLRAVCAMWSEAFPTAPGRDRFAEALSRRKVERDEWVHVIFDDHDVVLAASRTFVREIVVDGEPRRILALAHVATSPRARGKGLGAAVVRQAFERLGDDGLGESIFCSGVPEFYLKLGAHLMPSTLKIEYPNEDSKPFHDPALLRYALESAKEIKGEAIIQVNGDGW